VQARPLRGAPPAFAGDDFIFAIGALANHDRLQQALFADGLGKILEFLFLELLARIVRI
jgi:hypothetical protein